MQKLLAEMVMYVIGSLIHNGVYLLLGILVAVAIKVYVDPMKIRDTILRKAHVSIPGSVAFGAFTPLCACGTMAVILAMLTTALPWGPIMAFLTSSPLMSPDAFILLMGVVGLKFAVALALASVIIGLGSGYLTHFIEKKTGFLNNQTRFSGRSREQTAAADLQPQQGCGCGAAAVSTNQPEIKKKASHGGFSGWMKMIKWKELADSFINIGIKGILLYFTVFVAVGFLINRFVPTSIIKALFSSKNIFAVPLAALIGLPLYVNGESAIPLIKSLMASGAGGGAMLAFMITGPGTSAGVIAGITTFMKRRAVLLYMFFLLGWGILLGYAYDLLMALGV